jgi:glucan phosphoethanolaminetransferase (alkaline phosphatase superfamily)
MVGFESILGVVALLCAIWVIYSVLVHHKNWKAGKKAIWIICAVLFSIITAIVYFFIGKKK